MDLSTTKAVQRRDIKNIFSIFATLEHFLCTKFCSRSWFLNRTKVKCKHWFFLTSFVWSLLLPLPLLLLLLVLLLPLLLVLVLPLFSWVIPWLIESTCVWNEADFLTKFSMSLNLCTDGQGLNPGPLDLLSNFLAMRLNICCRSRKSGNASNRTHIIHWAYCPLYWYRLIDHWTFA